MRFVSRDGEDASFEDVRHRARHYRPHPLHSQEMVWKQTNCYVDMWLEVLRWWGFNPYAALPFTIALDFEGDQFTFFKFPHDELERLYGIVVQEHSIYEPLDQHIETQVARGHLMIVEVDAWFLPDTRGSSYRTQHTKTTIGIDAIDRAKRQIGYFHNSGYYVAEDFDYNGLVGGSSPMTLPPYVECAKRRFAPLDERELCETSLAALQRHLRRLPVVNPIAAFRRQLQTDARTLADSPLERFHAYSFNSVRQLGANFELFGHYARWLQASGCVGPFGEIRAACDRIASEAMVLEFRLARACARGKEERGDSTLEAIEAAYTDVVACARQIALPPRHMKPVRSDTAAPVPAMR
ncbi:DUF1839 family protein [Burkholderia contaminans]|nr:DUF1839 family protein [Burkholderia contaminans]